MDIPLRTHFNRAYADSVFTRYERILTDRLGPFPFRLAETPLFMTQELRQSLARSATEIVGALAEPETLAQLKKAIPARYDVPRMDALPHCVQVDFALTAKPGGGLRGQVVELQAFPSLYVLESDMSDAWATVLNTIPGLQGDWSCFLDIEKEKAIDIMRRTIVGDEDPAEVVLVDLDPESQKTIPDFIGTQKMFGVDYVCVTKLIKQGTKLFREKDGKLLRVKRLYNRMVFDELEAKGVTVPFGWNEELDVTWCSHPNWYWAWSKYSLPYLSHPAVPKSRLLSDVGEPPTDLENYVLKPLFSFAGAGVIVDLTRDALDAIPTPLRSNWVLQEKVEYAPAITMPSGEGVKAEVRVMLLRPETGAGSNALVPLLCLVRLSRGKMLGVDFNRGHTWVGGTVGMWR
jgi:hypothetical protein